MKHFAIVMLCCTLLCTSTLSAHVVEVNGTPTPIDTIDHYQVGPGVFYTHFTIAYSSSRTCHFYMLTADLTNPYNKVREYQPIFKSQATFAKAYQEMNAPGYRPIGGVNCNFWQVSASTNDLSGMPQSATASGGRLNTEPSSWILSEWHQEGVPSDDPAKDQGLVMIDDLGRCIIDSVYWQGYVFYGDNQRRKIREVNRPRINPNNNEIELFTPFLGSFKTRKPSEFTNDNGYGVYNVITKVDNWSINDTLEAIVERIDSVGGLTVGDGHAIFQGRGTGKETLQTFHIGDTIRFCLGIKTRRDGLRPHIMEMCTGNALVMENGELNQRNWNDAYNYKQYARTGIATNTAGDKLWLMTCQTPGVYTHEMCAIFKAAGATEVAACDGGGSAQCALGDKVMNPTTEATPRAVVNQLWLISTAPDSQEAGQLQFVKPLASIPAYASYTPTLRAWTAEGILLSLDYKGYTLSCEPASLGTISTDGLTFTANPVSESGKLIAVAGTSRAETPIEIRNGEV
ncbi:MAG: phosphodiester glycosidase family protein, partial [Paludibacteraceae bacterium]|nr:phosphodiester glycosidase family protein [Paludibacteraceae bacterium]